MTLFRPCIDLHQGRVKQIVGGSLRDGEEPQTNFVAQDDAADFARRYRQDALEGGHVILLGPGNEDAACRALAAWPGGLQVGGGVDAGNAATWLARGAAKVVVTSWIFVDGRLDTERVAALERSVGRDRLVLDLSCRRDGRQWRVATHRWQRLTDTVVDEATLATLARSCSEFLIHAADVEGRRSGMDEELVAALGRWSTVPCTYAGGARDFDDLALVERLSDGRVDLTIGSALDLFGGSVPYRDCVAWNRARTGTGRPDGSAGR